jgi:RecA-family ATPase
MDIISKALEVAEDYPVFPCDAKKRPVCHGGFKAATQDPDEVERLFSASNAALIGIPTGEVSGVSVIDIDVRDGKQGKEWVEKNAELLGITKVSETQSGGWHYYYQHVSGIRNRAGIDGCVDVRGDGGYVIHPESTGYRWVNDEDFAAFPPKVAAQSTGVAAASLDVPMGSDAFDAFGRRVDGREHYMASMVLAAISDYFRKHGTFPTMQWMEQEVYPTYEIKVGSRTGDLNAEGRGIDEFRKKVTSTIIRAREGKIADIHIAPNKDSAPASVSSSVAEVPQRKIKVKTLGELRATPPPSFMVADYIIENSFAVLYGAPASFKSFLAIDWALSIAHGVDWNGRPTAQGAVVYLAMEGQSGIAVRAEAWHRDMQLGDEGVPFYAVTTPIGMAMEDAPDVLQLRQAIEDTLEGIKPSLIVVDTLARSFAGSGADENSATDMGMFIRSCDLLKEWFDCTVLAVHHSGKDYEKGLRGSSSLLGAVDTSIAIKRTTGTEYIEVIVQKQKDVSEADPLAMAAREVAFVQDAFAQEQSSLVLDVTDGIPKNKKLSDGQQQCIDVLAELLRAGTFTETDRDGSKGVRSDVLRRAVAADGKNYSDSGWSDFTSRLVSKELLSKNNGLFNIGMKA